MGFDFDRLNIAADMQARRARATASLSPAAKHQAFPTIYAKPVPLGHATAEAREEAKRLSVENAELRAKIARLEEEKLSLAGRLEAALLVRHVPVQAGPALRNATILEVQSVFCKTYNELSGNAGGEPYTLADLSGPNRYRDVAWPRQVCMALVRRVCAGKSLPQIGKAFGGRDHTTVMHALNVVADHLKEVPALAATHSRVIEHFRVR